MRTPKLFLDTNLPSKLNGPYRGDVERIMSVITDRFKIVSSPQTFYELLDKLQGGDGSHFESDRELFRLMVGRGAVEFLPLPGAFALRKLLGLESPLTKFGPADFRKCLRVLLHAESRGDLFSGRVRIPQYGRRRSCGFQPEVVRHQHEVGQAQHREWLEDIRDGKRHLSSPAIWAVGYAKMLGQSVNEEQAHRFASGLDAVYQYSEELCKIVTGSQSYNYEKHRGDWIDLQQLHYLCDSSIHLLTDDGALRNRVKNSSQSDRILSFRDFLSQHGLTPRH